MVFSASPRSIRTQARRKLGWLERIEEMLRLFTRVKSPSKSNSKRPVRAQGGFLQLGFPLSRIFDADPKGRGAGWTAYLYYGYDQAAARDARRFGARGTRSDLFSGNVQYKLNTFVTFAYEQGYYRTRAANRAGALPLFRGIPSYTTHDLRSELAAIFTF